jgi:hypothetical protein
MTAPAKSDSKLSEVQMRPTDQKNCNQPRSWLRRFYSNGADANFPCPWTFRCGPNMSALAGESLDPLVNASMTFSIAIQQQLVRLAAIRCRSTLPQRRLRMRRENGLLQRVTRCGAGIDEHRDGPGSAPAGVGYNGQCVRGRL